MIISRGNALLVFPVCTEVFLYWFSSTEASTRVFEGMVSEVTGKFN